MAEDALLQHAGDVFERARARLACNWWFRMKLNLHQANCFAVVACAAEVAARLLHDLGEDQGAGDLSR